MSEYEMQLESILAADCGHATTRVALIDRVDGQYRFVARADSLGTAGPPWNDLSVGLVDAVERLQSLTGRSILDENGQIVTPEDKTGQGVDGFVAVSSVAQPLRVILVGMSREVSMASARRAALSTCTEIVDVISVEQPPEWNRPCNEDEMINAIWHAAPDVICIVGGTDGGSTVPLLNLVRDVVRVAVYLMGESAPPVLFAGNAQIAGQIAKMFEGLTEVRLIDNVRPVSDAENIAPLQDELEAMFYDRKMAQTPGINVLGRWSGRSVVLPTARMTDYTLRFLAQSLNTGKPALAIDVGSATVTLNVAQGDRALTTLRTDLGVGHALRGMLERIELDKVLRWVPFEIDPAEAHNRLLNQALHPTSIPQTREDLWLLQAVAREVIRQTLADSRPGWPLGKMPADDILPPCDPIIGLGRMLTCAPSPGHAALILLDALQPSGVGNLYMDECELMPLLGAVGVVEPLAMVQVLRNDGLTLLGTAVAPVGQARVGDKVLTVKGVEKSLGIHAEIRYGQVVVLPLYFDKPVRLELVPARGFDIGRGTGQSWTIEYRGGTLGLIIDARGRPLELPRDGARRRAQLEQWLSAMEMHENKVG